MEISSSCLRCDDPHVVFQECPDEVSLCFSIFGCPLRCEGCHSEALWEKNGGIELNLERFQKHISQYAGLITAVVFFGGEWRPMQLQVLLKQAKRHGLKTCLYTGLNHVSRHIRPYLDFAKTGAWQSHLGGLASPTTNQRFYRVVNGEFTEDMTSRFQSQVNQTPASQNQGYSPSSLNKINTSTKAQERQNVAA